MKLLNSKVLVLNQSYEPMSICDAKKAIVLVFAGKAQLVAAHEDQCVRAVSLEFPMPSVVRLNFYVAVPFKRIMLSRKNILRRDNFQCQYCEKTDLPLTIDHVVPKSQGGGDTWDNLVTACTRCNNIKANRTPEQAKMPLMSKPIRPSHVMFMRQYVGNVSDSWKPFLFMT